MEIESRLSNCQGLGSGELGVNADGVLFRVIEMFWNYIVVIVALHI